MSISLGRSSEGIPIFLGTSKWASGEITGIKFGKEGEITQIFPNWQAEEENTSRILGLLEIDGNICYGWSNVWNTNSSSIHFNDLSIEGQFEVLNLLGIPENSGFIKILTGEIPVKNGEPPLSNSDILPKTVLSCPLHRKLGFPRNPVGYENFFNSQLVLQTYVYDEQNIFDNFGFQKNLLEGIYVHEIDFS